MKRKLLPFLSLVSSMILAPDNPNITYVGRTCTARNGTHRLLDWAGVQVVSRFRGSALSADLKGSSTGDRFLVEVDGVPTKKFLVSSSAMQTFTLVKDLPDGEHTLSLWRISEDNAWSKLNGATTFGGFTVSASGFFLAAPVARPRRLEFWGDSNIAGWCVDGMPSGSDNPQAPVQNTYDTWAAQLARELHADFVAEAISGIGVTEQCSGGAIHHYVDGACTFTNADWDYTAWTPHAVVFWLGLNDPHPRSQQFHAAYLALMEHAAKKYEYAEDKPKLIHVCGSFNNGSVDPCASIQAVIESFNNGRTDGFRSYYAPISAKTWNSVCKDGKFHGCDAHYNQAGHRLVKDDILPRIQDILQWSNETSNVIV